MSNSDQVRETFREIPSVDDILANFHNEISSIPYPLVLQTIRTTLNEVRKDIQQSLPIDNISKHTFNKVQLALNCLSLPNLKQVINGTGIILHTGLGRAPLSAKLVKDALQNVLPYSNVELDLPSGKRGERNTHVESLVNALTGSEATVVVNNNAAAVLLMLNALADGKEVIISR